MRRYDWSAGYCMIYACVQGSWRSLIWDLKRIRKQVEKSAMNLAGIPILRTLAITWPQRALGVLHNPAVAAQVEWIVVQPGLVSWHYTAHDSCTFAYCFTFLRDSSTIL